MALDGKTIASDPRGIHNPQAISFAFHYIDAAPGHLGPSDVAPSTVDETRVGNALVSGYIRGREESRSGLEGQILIFE